MEADRTAAKLPERPCSATNPHESHVYWLGGNHEDAGRSYRCPGRSAAHTVSRAETIRRALRVNISAAEHEEVLAALDSLLGEREQFRVGLEELLSVAERGRTGDPTLDPEEWYAIRDYARKVLNDAD